jgi:hypothetical protein
MKPFNPLLGETFEFDRMADLGWRSFTEQVNVHFIYLLKCFVIVISREPSAVPIFDCALRVCQVLSPPLLGSAICTFHEMKWPNRRAKFQGAYKERLNALHRMKIHAVTDEITSQNSWH